jgi:MFS family permease
MLLIGFALLRGTAIGGLSLVSQQVVNLWFVQRRGIAAAAASLGLAAGSMVFPRFFDYLIALHGWRGAYLALAVLVALTILPVAAALFRDRPEKFGLTPDAGLPPVEVPTRKSTRVLRWAAVFIRGRSPRPSVKRTLALRHVNGKRYSSAQAHHARAEGISAGRKERGPGSGD